MNSTLQRGLSFIRLLIVAAFLLGVSFVANAPHAVAEPMGEHSISGDTQSDCAAYCANRNTVTPQYAVLNHEETRTPDPAPAKNEAYYRQFQALYAPSVLRSYVYGSYSIRPPDIVASTASYRL